MYDSNLFATTGQIGRDGYILRMMVVKVFDLGEPWDSCSNSTNHSMHSLLLHEPTRDNRLIKHIVQPIKRL